MQKTTKPGLNQSKTYSLKQKQTKRPKTKRRVETEWVKPKGKLVLIYNDSYKCLYDKASYRIYRIGYRAYVKHIYHICIYRMYRVYIRGLHWPGLGAFASQKYWFNFLWLLWKRFRFHRILFNLRMCYICFTSISKIWLVLFSFEAQPWALH